MIVPACPQVPDKCLASDYNSVSLKLPPPGPRFIRNLHLPHPNATPTSPPLSCILWGLGFEGQSEEKEGLSLLPLSTSNRLPCPTLPPYSINLSPLYPFPLPEPQPLFTSLNLCMYLLLRLPTFSSASTLATRSIFLNPSELISA